MQDFKTGHLIGASPRAQFQGQLIGSLVSIFVTTTAFTLYSRAYQIPGPNFPAPTAYVWLNLARLLRSKSLPLHVVDFMVGFGIWAGMLAALKIALSIGPLRKYNWLRVWVPSGVAFAIGMLNTPNFSLARLVGGVIELWWRKREIRIQHARLREAARLDPEETPDQTEDRDGAEEQDQNRRLGAIAIIIIASGFVLGEGVASIVNLGLKMGGIGQVSCWGCVKGVCGGCP